MALNLQWLIAYLDLFRLRQELAFTLALEKVERAGKVADDQIEIPVAVPVNREGPRADVLDPVFGFNGNDQRLAVRTVQHLGLFVGAVRLSPENLKQARHGLLHAGIGA